MTASINANTTTGVVVTSDTSAALALQTGGTTALTINSSQNVGIGTSSPTTKLQVVGTIKSGITGTNGTIQVGRTSDGATLGTFSTDGSDSILNSATAWAFQINTAEKMRIDSSGYVYVGTTTNANNGAMIVQQASNGTGITVNGVNNTSGAVFMYFTEAGANCGYIQRVGTTGAVVYATSSDYRLKENIAPMTGALNKVALLKPVTYDWKAGGSSQGFIAHELQEVLPDAVTGEKDQVNEDGSINAQGIDQSRIVATLTAAIQELNAKVDAQALEIQALKGASA